MCRLGSSQCRSAHHRGRMELGNHGLLQRLFGSQSRRSRERRSPAAVAGPPTRRVHVAAKYHLHRGRRYRNPEIHGSVRRRARLAKRLPRGASRRTRACVSQVGRYPEVERLKNQPTDRPLAERKREATRRRDRPRKRAPPVARFLRQAGLDRQVISRAVSHGTARSRQMMSDLSGGTSQRTAHGAAA